MMVQGIIQVLLPEVQRDVILQHPSTMEALTEAAAVGERNAQLMAKTDNQKDATYYDAKINRLEATIDAMQQIMASDRKAVATVNAVGGQLHPGAPTPQRQQSDSYNTGPYNTGDVASAPTPFRARSRGRGYRGTGGTWIARPPMGNRPPIGPFSRPPAPRRQPPPMQQQQAHPANQEGEVTDANPPSFQQDVAAPTFQQNRAIWCGNCGRSHHPGHCRVAGFACWNCSGVGHVQSCCPYLNATPPPSQH